MSTPPRKPLEEYLALPYPLNVIADPGGGYVVFFPDLPGCATQVATLEEAGAAAERTRRAWIGARYGAGEAIPLPTYPEEFSGKYNVKLPAPLQRSVVAAAALEGLSFREYVVRLFTRGGTPPAQEGQGRDEAGEAPGR